MRSSSIPPVTAAVTAADAVPHRITRARQSFDSDATDDDDDDDEHDSSSSSSHHDGAETRSSRHPRPNNFLDPIFGWFGRSTPSHNFQQLSSDENGDHEVLGRSSKRVSAGKDMPFAAVVRIIAMTSKLNVLLVFVPVGITLNFIPGMPAVLVFACNTISLVPLSSLLSYATECIASELGDTIGALINISLGNLIELITLFVALKEGKVHIVQGALVGSILVNLLFVLGCAIIVGDFLAAGLEQQFDVSHAQALACLLALSVMSILIPIGFHYSMEDQDAAKYAVLSMSRISAIILLLVYAVYVTFLLRPSRRHARPVSVEEGTANSMSSLGDASQAGSAAGRSAPGRTVKFAGSSSQFRHGRGESIELRGLNLSAPPQRKMNEVGEEDSDSADSGNGNQSVQPVSTRVHNAESRSGSTTHNGNILGRVTSNSGSASGLPHTRSRSRSLTMLGAQHMDLMGRYMRQDNLVDITDEIAGARASNSVQHWRAGRLSADLGNNINTNTATALVATLAAPIEENLPPISRNASLILLLSASVMTAICAEFIVANIEQVTAATGFSKAFIGLIVLPIAGNAAEFITAISVAAVGKADLALGVSFGSSIQISLFVAPLMILGGWFMDQDMTLDFGVFDTIALIGSALVVNVLITNGRSNYLEGCLLVACYVLVAVGAFLSP